MHNGPMTDSANPDEKLRFRQEFLRNYPPRIRFAPELRLGQSPAELATLDHFEFMVAVMQAHPIFFFEECSFGSDLLDARRALAYHIIVRQLGHARSLIVNANIRNRVGVGTALRCMLEIYAFAKFFDSTERLNDDRLMELFLLGQSFAIGGWYELEKVWQESHGEPIPEDARKFFEDMFGIPRVKTILKPTHAEDEGFSYLYARYSEFVHPAFARPRNDFEEAIGLDHTHPYGSSQYYDQEVNQGAPLKLLSKDVEAGSVCLEMFWGIASRIDPHFDNDLRPQILEVLRRHGFGPESASSRLNSLRVD
jgi:hypothetical protein